MRQHFTANITTPDLVYGAHQIDIDEDSGVATITNRNGQSVATMTAIEVVPAGYKQWLLRGLVDDAPAVWRAVSACACRGETTRPPEGYELPAWPEPASA